MIRIKTELAGTQEELRDELVRRCVPRSDLVEEQCLDRDRFGAVGGPFSAYERRVGIDEMNEGRYVLRESIECRLAVPFWAWLLYFPVRFALKHRRDSYNYWWAPPDRIDARCATVMALLCAVQVVDGYLGTVLTQTLTFAADEFGYSNTAQGVLLAVVRVGVLLALVTVAAADRHGRRRLLIATGILSCALTGLGAVSPQFWFLGATQLVARGLSTALGVLIAIVAAEELPARSRAWGASILVLCAGLGAGMAVWVLPVADLHTRGWRIVYLVPVLGIGVMIWAGRQLPESQRFLVKQSTTSGRVEVEVAERRRKRFVLLAGTALLVAMFAAPASGLQNDFLKDERGYSAAAISLFTLVTSTPAGIGVLVGGYLADRRGRRPVGAVGLAVGAVFVTASFFMSGAGLWLATLAGTLIGGMTVPALAVYGPELFGTSNRGSANGWIVTIGVVGSAIGLFATGVLSDAFGGQIGPALALMALGPLVVAVLVITKYPETAGTSLEDLNPEDQVY